MTSFKLGEEFFAISLMTLCLGILFYYLFKYFAHFFNNKNMTNIAIIFKKFRFSISLIAASVFFDDLFEIYGLSNKWWYDEVLNSAYTLIVIFVLWSIISILRYYLEQSNKLNTENNTSNTSLRLIFNSLIVVLIIGAIFVVLSIWHISLTPYLASAGLLTAVGALFSKYLSGISIYIDRPFHIGDFVVLPSGERGEVIEVGIRSTRIRTRDDILIIVPNQIMAEGKIINESREIPNYRVRCKIQIDYENNLEEVERVLLDSLQGNEFILSEPKPRVRFRAFSDTGITVELLSWIEEPANRGRAVDLIIRNIHKRCFECGIKLATSNLAVLMPGENVSGMSRE